jgi:hypothetical protein
MSVKRCVSASLLTVFSLFGLMTVLWEIQKAAALTPAAAAGTLQKDKKA